MKQTRVAQVRNMTLLHTTASGLHGVVNIPPPDSRILCPHQFVATDGLDRLADEGCRGFLRLQFLALPATAEWELLQLVKRQCESLATENLRQRQVLNQPVPVSCWIQVLRAKHC